MEKFEHSTKPNLDRTSVFTTSPPLRHIRSEISERLAILLVSEPQDSNPKLEGTTQPSSRTHAAYFLFTAQLEAKLTLQQQGCG